MRSLSEDEQWARVWGEMTDAELEDRVRMYMWLAANTPNSHASRVAQLVAECNRRGKPDIVERVRAWLLGTPETGSPEPQNG